MQKQSSKEVKLSCIGLVGARDTWMSKNEGRKGGLYKSFKLFVTLFSYFF